MFSGEQGVVKILPDKQVVIMFDRGDACDNCGLKVLCAPGHESESMLKLPFQEGLLPGQHVRLEEKRDLELHLALVQYGLPMLAFLAGLLLGYFLPIPGLVPEVSAFVSACLFVAGSFFIARRMVAWINRNIFEKFLRILPV
ncbi:MAG: SoxR reducing system RseC family protein [Candidatus Marinimicrobia bacterium]|nr:SoxR reducing system RseC family protein [Candidatus Neomarinimicrobiota bacterium]MCF7903801.1 SoxR reducing system RseC family protein [Candidatus Neomarinimicrobiota bacterium]